MVSEKKSTIFTLVNDAVQGQEFRKRKKYDDAFKRNAVRILLESGMPVATVAQSIGIDRTILQRWRKKFGTNPAINSTDSQSDTVSVTDFLSLKKELASTKEAVDHLRIIVKKALTSKYIDSQ